MTYGGVTLSSDRSWIALGLVVCAHLAAFAALRPQPQSLPLETVPEPITVSLLSAPQAAPQQPKPAADLTPKVEKTVKPKTNREKINPTPSQTGTSCSQNASQQTRCCSTVSLSVMRLLCLLNRHRLL